MSLTKISNEIKLDERIDKKCRLRVFVRIVLMILKFQKRLCEDCIYSFEYTFDKQEVLEKLSKNLYFYIYQPEKLVYLIRKFKLNFSDLSSEFIGCLKNAVVGQVEKDQRSHYFLILVLKYLCRNTIKIDRFISVREILAIISNCTDNAIRSEFVLTLAYVIENSKLKLNIKMSSEINKLLNNSNISDEAKGLLICKIEARKGIYI